MALSTKLLSKLTLEKDLSVDREIIEKGHVRHFRKAFGKNYSSVMLMNILFLVTALPVVFLFLFLRPALEALATANMNFSGDLGLGFLGASNDFVIGAVEVYKIRMIIFACCIPCFSLIGIGAAGLFYCCRNIIWGANVKMRVHFLRGIRKYWWQYVISFTIIGLAIVATACSITGYLMFDVVGTAPWWIWICMILSCLITVLLLAFFIVYLPMIPQYRIKERDKIKNSMILAFVTVLPMAMLFVILAIPFLLMLSSFASTMLLLLFAIIGFSLYALGITEYSQFCSDNFTNALYNEKLLRMERDKKRQVNQVRKVKKKAIGKR